MPSRRKHKTQVTVFDRIRAATREQKEFVPAPIILKLAAQDYSVAAVNTIYVTAAQFSAITGIGIEDIEELIEMGKLPILPIASGSLINRIRGLVQLERLEMRP